MGAPADAGSPELARRALTRARLPVAQVIALQEDQRPDAGLRRDEMLAALEAAAPAGHECRVIGVTGTPGSGKSSLLARVVNGMLAADPAVTIAIVAVDPSSSTSKGALLGDRTRMRLDPAQRRVFFRSQASATALGGLAPSTYNVCRALSLIYDRLIIETVGIGQSEADIRHLADTVYLVMAPLGGDEIQYLKAGIMEIPNAFVISKWDEPAAAKTYHQLRASLWLARPFDSDSVPIYCTSAKTGHGIDDLTTALLNHVPDAPTSGLAAKQPYFFERWVTDEWGRAGLRHLTVGLGGAPGLLDRHAGFGAAQREFDLSLRVHLGTS